MQKSLFVLIVAIICLFMFSCSGTPQSEKSGLEDGSQGIPGIEGDNSDTAPETKEDILDKLPQKNYGGKEIRILNTSGSYDQYWLHLDICADTETGEPLNDSIFARNRKVEEHYNVKIKEIEGAGTWNVRQTAEKSIKAGSDDFEIFLTDTNNSSSIAAQNLTVDFNNLPAADLTAPYWDQDMIRDLSINNKIYFLAGDFLLTHYDATQILMVNKKMIRDLQLADPYELVKNNNWTFDNFYDLCKSVGKDLNGDGTMDQNDMFGYSSMHHMMLPSFMLSAGQWSIFKDAGNKPVLNINSPAYINTYTKYIDMLSNPLVFFDGAKMPEGTDSLICEELFRSGQTLFWTEITYYAIGLRDLDMDFGFLPHPKYDATSSISKSYVINPNAVNIPVTNSDLECTAVILEALNSISRDTVIPAYYEITLKLKASRDEQSSEVIDLIFNNRSYDMGFNLYDGVVGSQLIKMARKNDVNISSFYEKNAQKIETQLQKTIDFYFGKND